MDGICRRCPCSTDVDCAAGEWCDFALTKGCRGPCFDDSGCLVDQGEECRADGRCWQSVFCVEGEPCHNCSCDPSLVCAPDRTTGESFCRPTCHLYRPDCTDGRLCQPVLRSGLYPEDRGACVPRNHGASGGQPCTTVDYCEADLLCINGTCYQVCNPGGSPGCGGGIGCWEYFGIGACTDGCACDTDAVCNLPDEICEDCDCVLGCHMPGTSIECPPDAPCDPTTGRCTFCMCASDSDCNPPETLCDEDSCQCYPGCTLVGCPGDQNCDPATGECRDREPDGVLCGWGVCGPPEVCCVSDEEPYEECTATDACAGDLAVVCDGPEDCGAGQACCRPSGAVSRTYCVSGACPAGGTLCRRDTDCAAGESCEPDVLFGWSHRVCAAGP
ncbi:MAG: hypothetical protein ABI333_17145 [bacterium]